MLLSLYDNGGNDNNYDSIMVDSDIDKNIMKMTLMWLRKWLCSNECVF